MNRSHQFPPPFRLEDRLVLPELNRIVGPDGDAQLEPRVMQILLHLAEQPGQVRSRNELLDLVWGDAVVGEENLTRAVSDLRRVLGDDPRRPRFVETIRSHGYRLICAVDSANDEAVDRDGTGIEAAPAENEPADIAPTEAEPADVAPTEAAPAEAAPADIAPTETAPAEAAPAETAPSSGAHPAPRLSRSLAPVLPLVLLVLIAGFWLLRPLLREAISPDTTRDGGTPAPLTAVPLTSYPGREWQPALSADGQRVAFAWAGPEGDNVDIYVKQRGRETPLRLTHETGWAAWPTWSPDGQSVAFVQADDRFHLICTVPADGGEVRPLLRTASWIDGLDWSPLGDRLVFSAQMTDLVDEASRDEASAGAAADVTPTGRHHLLFLDLTTLAVTPFTGIDATSAGDFQPRFAPDGSALAWIGMDQTGALSICLASLSSTSGPPQRLASGMAALQGLAWTADSGAVVYAAAPAGVYNLWRVPRAGGPATWLPTRDEYAWNPAIARTSGDLVYEQVRFDRDIRRIEIRGRDPWQLATSTFVTSTRWDYDAAFGPDGRQVVFVSARSGNPELWLCDDKGAGLSRLTTLGETSVSNPRWSEDGRQIGFNVLRDGRLVVLVVTVNGGPPRVVTPAGRSEVFAGWSRRSGVLLVAGRAGTADDPGDGESGRRSEEPRETSASELWQISTHNLSDGSRHVLTHAGGLMGQLSQDERWLYHVRPGRSGLWRQALTDDPAVGLCCAASEPELVAAGLGYRDRFNWTVQGDDVVFVTRRGANAYLMYHDLRTGRAEPLTDLPGLAGSGLAVSPDGATVLYTRSSDMAGDLMRVDGFGLTAIGPPSQKIGR